MLWFPPCSPKMATCLQKDIDNSLPTKSRLAQFGILQNTNCSLCDARIEDKAHLFFDCPFSKYLWELCLSAHKRPDTWSSLLIKEQFSSKLKTYKLARLVFSATIWHIWRERNRRIFNSQRLHKITVFRGIYEDINILMRTCQWKVGNDCTQLGILSN